MRFVVRPSNAIKSVLLATNHRHPYGAKPKVDKVADFEVVGGRNRLSF